uniref:Uncharacterized protein n=1 Tax=Panagrolaimus sp. PS1159 TaxID=55785 RepID=A0AC35GY78_9BILA
MSVGVKLREKIICLLLFFISVGSVWSKCEVYLTELHTPVIPFINEIPETYNEKGEFEPSFDEFYKGFKNHPSNFYEFQRYCKNLNDQNYGNYGFAVIEVFDNLENRPIVHQYFKFNHSNFDSGFLMVGNLGAKKFSEIQIQKMSYQTFLLKEKFNTRKYSISKNYVFIIFEITPKTSWMDVHFDYGEKYVSFAKIDTLIEDSIDVFILTESYGIDWLKQLMNKLNVPSFKFESSSSQSWTRCCNNWFISQPTPGTENSCCSEDLKTLSIKVLPSTYKESQTCKIPGCLLIEGEKIKIKGSDQNETIAIISKMGEKGVQFKYNKDGKEVDIVLGYEKIFSTHHHITMLNCTTELPDIIDIDEMIKSQLIVDNRNLRNEIIFCFFNETLKEKMCGRFWIGQNITVLNNDSQKETIGTISSLYTNSNAILIKLPDGHKVVSFDALKKHNPQNFERKDCIIPPKNEIPIKSINIGTFNRSIAIKKCLPIDQTINVTTAENQIQNGIIVKLHKMHAELKDFETGIPMRQSYNKIILENPFIFDKIKSDKSLELYYIEGISGKNFSTILNVNESQSYDFSYNGKIYNGVIDQIFGDIGFVMMNTTDLQEIIPVTIENIHFLNIQMFKKKIAPIPCLGFKGKRFRIPHSHQRKISDC